MLRLAAIRKSLGMSQAELARRTGIHPATISALEHGRIYPWPKYRRLISRELKMSADKLFEEVAE